MPCEVAPEPAAKERDVDVETLVEALAGDGTEAAEGADGACANTYAPISHPAPLLLWLRVETAFGHVEEAASPSVVVAPRFSPESIAGEDDESVKLFPAAFVRSGSDSRPCVSRPVAVVNAPIVL